MAPVQTEVQAAGFAEPRPASVPRHRRGGAPRSWRRFRTQRFGIGSPPSCWTSSWCWLPTGARRSPNRDDEAFFSCSFGYHIGFWTWKGTTVGGIICQLRLVRVDGGAAGFADALVRGLSSIFSLAVLGIGCLWILKDPERQAWHDKIAGTYVVKVPRNWPL